MEILLAIFWNERFLKYCTGFVVDFELKNVKNKLNSFPKDFPHPTG